MSKLRRFRYWPEAASLLTGVATPYGSIGLILVLSYSSLFSSTMVSALVALLFMGFVSAALSAFLYLRAERPRMWVHLPIFILSVSLTVFLTLSVVFAFSQDVDIPVSIYLFYTSALQAAVVIWYYGLYVLLGALPVCVIYPRLFRKRFAKTTTQGGESQ